MALAMTTVIASFSLLNELTVRDLGFLHGAITATIYTKAAALGLCLCPLELGPHFRLHYRDQPDGRRMIICSFVKPNGSGVCINLISL